MKQIEIFGGGFLNKGAELMLRITIDQLRRSDPQLRLAVEAQPGTPYETRAALGLRHIFPTVSLYRPQVCRFLFRSEVLRRGAFMPVRLAMPRRAKDQLGLTTRSQCDALVDISGYAFGDGFSWIKTKNAMHRCRDYHRRGRPVVFMPQMFGPFKNTKLRDTFRRCCDYATVIYAREEPSYEAVRAVIGDDQRLKRAPDITIFSAHEKSPDAHPADRPSVPYACLVPNERMLDQGKDEWAASYLDRLAGAAQAIVHAGIQPVVIVHAGDGKDRGLADQLRDRIADAGHADVLPVYAHPDPRTLKSFIAGSRFLIGSRFHALVAALSSAVPGVALGWAHKYEALARDFGVPELQHRGSDAPDHLVSLVNQLADPDQNAAIRAKLTKNKEAMRSQSVAMWTDVRKIVGLPPQPATDGQP